ncbi:MAG TPA: HlyD family efflux transporter periplasmic adaptor subunit [Vicinamibacterales bacterium]|jgi:HlyD family secretion protein|nr:HlyD family efflux transporter periplasmic adaptor subunit [Vicinamibacterales bacterium]
MSTFSRFALVLSAAGVAAACTQPPPSNALTASGNVEATEVQVGPEVGGRLVELRVAEGDRVKAGDVIATLDTSDTELQIGRARAERAAAAAQLHLFEAGARAEDVRQAEAQVDATTSEIAAIDVEIKNAQTDLDRFEALLSANAGSQKQRDDARARVDLARERRRAAEERVRVSRRALDRVRAGARKEELEGARARVATVDAQLAVLEKGLRDAQVTAPTGGVVTQKLVDAGEIVAPRVPIVVVTDLDHAWANVFVPEPMVPRIKLGQAATVRTDAGDRVPGKVTFVSRRAEFTPRNVQTADERSKLVYRVKVTVDNAAGVLKQGMPVDADFVLP